MSATLGLRRADDRMSELTGRLIAEFRDVLPAGAVLRCVARCRYQLRRAGVRAGLDHAAEAMARHRLRELRDIRAGG